LVRPAAEAFLVAFSPPQHVRRFFAEGAFNMAFVPMFSKSSKAVTTRKIRAGRLCRVAFILTPVHHHRDRRDAGAGVVDGLGLCGRRNGLIWRSNTGVWAFPYILFISLAASCRAC